MAQTAPRLGDVEANLREILRLTASARASGASLVVFPELALTGYALQDAVSATALPAGGEVLRELAAGIGDVTAVVGFVEEGPNDAFYNSAAVLQSGAIRAVHRKHHLPTYGLFDEARFFKPGADLTTFELGGWTLGLLICEEAWYPQTVHDLVGRGAEALLVLSAGPGRGVEGGDRWQTQESWWELVRYYARTYAVPVLLANRTGVEEGLFFGGSSAVVGPSGRMTAEAPLFEEALLLGELSRSALRRARMRHPGRPVGPPPRFDSLLFPPASLHAESFAATAALRDGGRELEGGKGQQGSRTTSVATPIGVATGRP